MLAHEILREVHFSDLYPRSFGDFYAKYRQFVNDQSLYVNFTDAVGNNLDKSFSPKANHHDPSGLYCYPLDYVLKHPSEIEYGQQARFLRVIRDTSKHKLVLNTMTPDMAVALLAKIGVEEPAKMMAFVQRRYKYFDGNLAAKQFLGVLQTYLKVGQKFVTPNREQTTLLLKAGIDALEDKSKSETEAIIYRAEPEQCVFLTRAAFKVIEVFELRSEKSRSIYHADPREMLRRLPGLIAQAIGDRIISNNMTGDRANTMTFYTAAQRKIVVMMDEEFRFLRGHRDAADHSKDKLTIGIMGPDFAPISASYPPDVSFEQVAADIGQRFAQREPAQGEAYTLMGEHGPDIKAVNDLVALICAKLKVPYTPATTEAGMFRVYRTIQGATANYKFLYAKTREAFIENLTKVVEQLWPGNRQPQGNQILQMYTAASRNRKISIADLHKLTNIGQRLGVSGWEGPKKEGSDYAKKYGDLTIFRRGAELWIRIGDFEQQIAQIDNMKLNDWKKPTHSSSDESNDFKQGYDYTFMLPHAKDLADYLNENHFIVDGYHTFLPQFYGISFVDGKWMPFEQAATPEGHIGKVALWKLPPQKHGFQDVVAMIDGKRSLADWGPGWEDSYEHWRAQDILFTVNDKNEIVHLGSNLEQYLRSEKDRKQNPSFYKYKKYPDDFYAGKDAGETLYKALEDAHFDPYEYIKQHGYTLSPALSDQLDLFGLVMNKDNDKVGKRYQDVWQPVGEYAGIKVYSVRPAGDRWSKKLRYYATDAGEKPRTLLATEPDSFNGKSNVSVASISDSLSPHERNAVKELLANLGLAVPSKFKKLLATRGS